MLSYVSKLLRGNSAWQFIHVRIFYYSAIRLPQLPRTLQQKEKENYYQTDYTTFYLMQQNMILFAQIQFLGISFK